MLAHEAEFWLSIADVRGALHRHELDLQRRDVGPNDQEIHDHGRCAAQKFVTVLFDCHTAELFYVFTEGISVHVTVYVCKATLLLLSQAGTIACMLHGLK